MLFPANLRQLAGHRDCPASLSKYYHRLVLPTPFSNLPVITGLSTGTVFATNGLVIRRPPSSLPRVRTLPSSFRTLPSSSFRLKLYVCKHQVSATANRVLKTTSYSSTEHLPTVPVGQRVTILKAQGYNVSVVGNPNTSLEDDVQATKRGSTEPTGGALYPGRP